MDGKVAVISGAARGQGRSQAVTLAREGASAVAYCAAKAGVIKMMRVLAWEAGEYNIRVNCVCPGGIQTPMLLDGGTVELAAELRPRYITNNRNLLPIEWQPPQSISDAVLF